MGKNCYLKMKALRTPGLLLWTRGVIHGKRSIPGSWISRRSASPRDSSPGSWPASKVPAPSAVKRPRRPGSPVDRGRPDPAGAPHPFRRAEAAERACPLTPGRTVPSQARSRERQTEARATCTARQLQLRQRAGRALQHHCRKTASGGNAGTGDGGTAAQHLFCLRPRPAVAPGGRAEPSPCARHGH